MSNNKDVLTFKKLGKDVRSKIRESAGRCVFEALSLGRRYIKTATPDVDLLFPKLSGGLGFVFALESAVVTLVEGGVFLDGK